MADFTLGIEEEFQIIDPVTRDLKAHITEMIDEGQMILGEQVKPEMHQSMIEVGTGICANVQEARTDVIRLRRVISELAAKKGLRIAAASTHPFSDWETSQITPNERYYLLIEEMQHVARSLLIFGMHVHVGIDDRDASVHLMNAARYFLPHVLALTTSSPFWVGRNTGLKSYRCEVFKKFPRTDIPDYFSSIGEFDSYVNLLIKTGCIDNAKKIWWDVRPHPFFPTLEFRICDLPSKVEEVVTVAALFQAIVSKLYKLHRQNMGFPPYRLTPIQQTKWRDVRHGPEDKKIDFGKQKEVPTRDLILELLDFIDDVVDELGSRKEIEYVHTILANGTSADRQLRRFEETGELTAVVDGIMAETVDGVIDGATLPGPQTA